MKYGYWVVARKKNKKNCDKNSNVKHHKRNENWGQFPI